MADEFRTELAGLTDVVDALRFEMKLLELGLDEMGELFRFEVTEAEVTLQVVVGRQTDVEGKAGGKLGFKVPSIGSFEVGAEAGAKHAWSREQTQKVTFKLRPQRLTEAEAAERKSKPGAVGPIRIRRKSKRRPLRESGE